MLKANSYLFWMPIKWGISQQPNGEAYRQIEVSVNSDWTFFEKVAKAIEKETAGNWKEKLDGLDQRYWDLEAKSGKITLHLEHYLGIIIYPSEGSKAGISSISLLESIFDFLSKEMPI